MIKRFLSISLSLALCASLAPVSLQAKTLGPDPVLQWEGAFDYAIVGGTVLTDSMACVNFTTGDKYCWLPDQIPSEYALYVSWPDYQGDTVSLWPNFRVMAGVPDDAQIEAAYIIWQGSKNLTGPFDTDVTFQPPDGEEINVSANVLKDCQTVDVPGFSFFTCRTDITTIMKNHVLVGKHPINGFWNFGNFEPLVTLDLQSSTLLMASWSIVILYQSGTIARKRIYFYEGFSQIQCQKIPMTATGFEVPEGATGKVTFYVGEGDGPISGAGSAQVCPAQVPEALIFNNSTLSDSCNPANNPYNSTRSTNVDPSIGKCEVNVYSTDLDTFDISSLIKTGDTTATISVNSGQDAIFTNFMMLSIDTKLPSFDIPLKPEKTSSLDSVGTVAPDEVFEYYIRVENHGDDVAHNVRVQDEIPEYTKYVCNSTYVKAPNGVELNIPDRGNCICPLTGEGYVIAAVQTVQTSTLDDGYSVRFKVRLVSEDEISKEAIIENVATISSDDGEEGYVTNGGIQVRLGVGKSSYEGKLTFAAGDHNPGNTFIFGGEKDQPVLQLKLTVDDGSVRISSLAFSASGSGFDPADVLETALYWDEDANGVVSGTDTLIGRSSIDSDNGSMHFDGIATILSTGTVKHLLLVYTFADSLSTGSTYAAKLEEGNVSLSGKLATNCLPITSGTLKVPTGDLLVYKGHASPASHTVEFGDTLVTLQVAFKGQTQSYTLNALALTNDNSTADRQISAVALYTDTNNDGDYNGETKLAESTFSSRALSYTGLSVALSAGVETNLLVVVSLNPQIQVQSDLSITVTANGFSASGANGAAAADGLPLSSPTFAVGTQVVVDGDTDIIADGDLDDNKADTIDPWDWNTDNGDNNGSGVRGSGCAAGGAMAAFASLLTLGATLMARRRRKI